jgi:hypothetical protein
MSADPRVARLRSLDTEATPGPWHTYHDGPVVYTSGEFFVGETASGANAALIAAMRNATPAIITLLERVLGRHKPGALTLRYCAACSNAHPCPDRTDALAVLDTLDSP